MSHESTSKLKEMRTSSIRRDLQLLILVVQQFAINSNLLALAIMFEFIHDYYWMKTQDVLWSQVLFYLCIPLSTRFYYEIRDFFVEGKGRNKFVDRSFCVSHRRIKRVWNSHSNVVWKGFVNILQISVHVCAHFYLGLGLTGCPTAQHLPYKGTSNVLFCSIKGQRMGKLVQTRDEHLARILSNSLPKLAAICARLKVLAYSLGTNNNFDH